jgi:hypothetical protein
VWADLLLASDEPEHLPNSKMLVGIAANAKIPGMYPFRDLVVGLRRCPSLVARGAKRT